ncbi:hypothetical protein [Nonomuraea sp. NPDC052265]|uniref:hypothetical protein n=1 Tax=Nonomuraea sp. NPDC052265 TaxID=3364374 RepID=UPI0037CBE388
MCSAKRKSYGEALRRSFLAATARLRVSGVYCGCGYGYGCGYAELYEVLDDDGQQAGTAAPSREQYADRTKARAASSA